MYILPLNSKIAFNNSSEYFSLSGFLKFFNGKLIVIDNPSSENDKNEESRLCRLTPHIHGSR